MLHENVVNQPSNRSNKLHEMCHSDMSDFMIVWKEAALTCSNNKYLWAAISGEDKLLGLLLECESLQIGFGLEKSWDAQNPSEDEKLIVSTVHTRDAGQLQVQDSEAAAFYPQRIESSSKKQFIACEMKNRMSLPVLTFGLLAAHCMWELVWREMKLSFLQASPLSVRVI